MNIQRRFSQNLLEVRQRTVQIRSAARKGKNAAEIAQAFGTPLKIVEQMLVPVADARLSDPAQLLNHVAVDTGLPPADIQVYWVGFLTAAGRVVGQGASSALIVTLGHRSQEYMQILLADLATPQVRTESCRSSLLGWQLYIRDRSLCDALVRWGIPSEVHGDDPTVLEDFPLEFMAPFLRGYLDGNWTDPGVARSRSHSLVFRGTEPALAAINAMIHRGWRITSGEVTRRPPQAELRFSRRDERVILDHIQTYRTRSRDRGKSRPT
ncbi:MAG TPA: hypothetical protein VFL28_02155 [bacterium]|nr:hypothetical protein [bacterium]